MEKARQSAALIHCVALIICQDNRLLMARSHARDKWYMPGGKIDPGESAEQALIREMREELSIELQPQTIRYQFTVKAPAHGKPEGTQVHMQCFTADYNETPTASAEIEEIAFLSVTDIDKVPPAGQQVMRRVLI